MKLPFYISTLASSLCLILSIIVLAIGRTNNRTQTELQKKQEGIQKQQQELQAQQEEINAANQIIKEIGPNLLRDLASASVKNEKVKVLLAKHGYNVQMKEPAPATPPTDTPAPKKP